MSKQSLNNNENGLQTNWCEFKNNTFTALMLKLKCITYKQIEKYKAKSKEKKVAILFIMIEIERGRGKRKE